MAAALRGILPTLRRVFPWRIENPVLAKELRTRIRGTRSYWLIAGYVTALGIAVSIAYLSWWTIDRMRGASPMGSQLGHNIFLWVFYLQAFLITVIPPALTAGAITLEREQKTLELLAVSTLKGREVVMGKLLPGTLMMLLLLFISAPVGSLSSLFGGVAPMDLVTAYVALALYGFTLSTMGIFWSAINRGTAGSVVVTFAVVFVYLMLAGVTATGLMRGMGAGAGATSAVPFAQTLTPFLILAVADRTVPVFGLNLPALVVPLVLYAMTGALFIAVASTKIEFLREDRSPWVRTLTLALSLTALFIALGNGWAFRALTSTPSLADARVAAMLALSALGAVVLVCTPALATGGPRQFRRPFRLYDPRAWFTSHPSGGLAFLVLWTALGTALVAGAMTLAGYPPTSAGMAETLTVMLVLIASVAFGLGGLGWAAARRSRSRGVGIMTVVLAIFFLLVVPAAVWAGAGPWRQPLQTLSPIRYLSPMAALDEQDNRILGQPAAGPQAWLITSGVYILVGAVALGLGGMRRRND